MSKSTIPLVYLTSFLFLFGETLQPAPRISIYESIVCQQHYGSPSPHDCKIAPVQQELALLGGIERLSIIIPSILAIPFAALADRYGHSLILAVAIFGVFLEDGWPFLVCWFPDVFPIRLIWLHFMFSCVGGGFTVVVTMLHVIIADVVSAEDRTKMFFRARAAGVAASILGYAASGLLMRVSAFLPWAVGLVCLLIGTITAALIPRMTLQDHDILLTVDKPVRNWSIAASLGALRSISKLLFGNQQVLAMLILTFFCQLGYDSVPSMLAIYISKRFGWEFSDASFLSSLEMGIELFALVIILPALTSGLPSAFQGLSTFAKDKVFAQASLVALAIGMFCLGLAPVVVLAIVGIVVLALGTGQDSLTRSIATEMVPANELSTLYSAITMLRAIGGSISGPIYAWLYTAALRHKGEDWLGLPYLVAGVFFVVALALMTVVRDPQKEISEEETEEGRPLLN
ncbi:MFS general substrate transporter [Didymella exigua CBS 183.55]|uniref:MFS general substrate transporter n=1 Tax=Didymella exigua CBS 183.55 TaxID=1150837 RepID=A0A6A5RR43_9PLEO|nr:MFS general substrate transporter [Didymella exigua CBS 183.55]KAF1928786.1 MFS general substrate transporter [Didymella exigua CBS 183.55]